MRKPELVNRNVIYEGQMITVHRDTLRAVRRVYAGEITNGLAVAGLLATALARADGYAGLGESDA